MRVAPYGTWESPVTLDRLVRNDVRVMFPAGSGHDVYWIEARPQERGRQVVVRARPGRAPEDVLPAPFGARTLVHEYGGLPYAVFGETVFFTNYDDQRLYRLDPGQPPEPITPEPTGERSIRYAAPVVTPDGAYVYAVRERHPSPDVPAGVVNDLVVVAADGLSEPRVAAEGHDFFSSATVSPDGRQLAWLSWDHPNMPWDGTELWQAEIGADHLPQSLRFVAGGPAESVIQPKYSPAGVLHFVSDRSGWWNLYADEGEDGPECGRPLAPMEADVGLPDWLLGRSSYVPLGNGSIVAAWNRGGLARLGVLRPGGARLEELELDGDDFDFLTAAGGSPASVLAVAGSGSTPRSVVRVTLRGAGRPPDVEVVRRGGSDDWDPSFVSVPQPIEFPTEGGVSAHALYYPPHNPGYAAPPGELPPLIVQSHGGPTDAALPVLRADYQFWTTRGIGVVDVNYGGSSGFGRAYRDRLKGRWGVVDVDDCVNAATFLARSGRADPRRLVIRGRSAGGFTTLCALTFRDVFAAGSSCFGIGDTAALAIETHKFESHYNDSLIGPWPAAEAIYRERSPALHAALLRTPIILFQGLEDKVVPPAQAEEMAAALRRNGVPFAYVVFEGEGHGWRLAESVRRTAEAELYFFGRVLGFVPAGELEPVEIENAAALGP